MSPTALRPTNHAVRSALYALCVFMLMTQVSPAFAQFTGTGGQALSWFVQLLTPVIPLACAVVGIACLTGRINWGWFLAAICGTALFFGREQVVSMFRSWLGV